MTVIYEWRGAFGSSEANALHSEAFGTRVFSDEEWDWWALVNRHSLGWMVGRDEGRLVGFVNVLWDGSAHAWIQDVMVSRDVRGQGVGTELVRLAGDRARAAGCEWLHVDFDDELRPFYFDACGFKPTTGGLIQL